MSNVNDAINQLYHEAAESCRKFAELNDLIHQIGPDGLGAAEFGRELEKIRRRVMQLYGVLGVLFPDNVSPTLAKLISPDSISSFEYRRRYLTLEDVFVALEDGLRRKPGNRDFSQFVDHLGIDELCDTPNARDADVSHLIAK